MEAEEGRRGSVFGLDDLEEEEVVEVDDERGRTGRVARRY